MATVWLGDFRLKQLQQYQEKVSVKEKSEKDNKKEEAKETDAMLDYKYLVDDFAEYSWFKNEALALLPQMFLDNTDIVLMLGFNDCVYSCTWPAFNINKIATNYVKVINKLVKEYSGISFYVCSVNPIDADYPFTAYQDTSIIPIKSLNSKIKQFNNILKEKCTATFINSYDYLNSTSFETRDGVRFTFDTCRVLQNFITNHLKPQAGIVGFIPRDTKDKAPPNPKTENNSENGAEEGAENKDTSYLYWKSNKWTDPASGQKGLNACIAVSNGWVIPNCVGYAWGRFMEILGTTPKLSTNNAEKWFGHDLTDTGKYVCSTNGKVIDKDFKTMADHGTSVDGYERGRTPKVGAVICWEGKDGAAGHVGIVEAVNEDGSILTSESGWVDRGVEYNEEKHFWVSKRNNSNGNWGSSTNKYIFQGFIYNPGLVANPSVESIDKSKIVSNDNYLEQKEMEINARYIWNYLGSKGWTLNAVAGMLGNMQHESTINPGLGEKGHSQSGYGLTQWTPKSKLTNWLAENKLPDDIDGQLTRIIYEKDNNVQYGKNHYKYTFTEFAKSTDDPYTLACAFAFDYERSGVVIWGFHTKNYSPCSIGWKTPSKCKSACVNSKACYIQKFGEAAAAQQAEVNRENLRKKRGGSAENWYKFLAPYAPGQVFEDKFIVDNLKIDKLAPTNIKVSFIVSNGSSASYKLFKSTSKKPKKGKITIDKDNSKLQTVSFNCQKLVPDTSYKLLIEVVGKVGENKKEHTIEFKTPQDYPSSFKSIKLIPNGSKITDPVSCTFTLKATQPGYIGYWKNNSGYDIQLFINNKCVNTKTNKNIKDISLNNFTIKDKFGYNCKLGDIIQIGLRAWVVDQKGKKLYDSSEALTSKAVCLLANPISVSLK